MGLENLGPAFVAGVHVRITAIACDLSAAGPYPPAQPHTAEPEGRHLQPARSDADHRDCSIKVGRWRFRFISGSRQCGSRTRQGG